MLGDRPIINPFEPPTASRDTRSSVSPFPWFRRTAFAGAVLFLGSIAHLALFVGIPYREPTPETADTVELHLAISNFILPCAAILLLTGVLGSVILRIVRAFRPTI